MIIKLAQGVIKMGKDAVDSVMEWWTQRKPFKANDGSDHEIFYQGKGKAAKLYVASNNSQTIPSFITKLNSKQTEMDSKQKSAYSKLKKLNPAIETLENKLEGGKSTDKQKDYQDLQTKLNEAIQHLSILLPLVEADVPKAIMPAFTNGVRAQSFEAMYITKDQPKQTPKGKPSSANDGKNLRGWLQLFKHNNPKTDNTVGANNAFEKTHLLHENLGGDATDSNLISASNAVNKRFRPMEKAAIADMKDNKKLWYKINILFHKQNPTDGEPGIDYSGYPKEISGSYGHLEANSEGKWEKKSPQSSGINMSKIPYPNFGTSVIHNINEMSARDFMKVSDGNYSISQKMAKFIYEDRMRKKSETKDGKRKRFSENTPYSGWKSFLERMEARKDKGTVEKPSDYGQAIALLTDLNSKGQIEF